MFPLAVIGGLVGAVAGAAISVGSDLVRGKPVDWKSAGAAALSGAVVGAVGASTLGVGLLAGSAVTQTAGMVVAGAAGGAVDQLADNAFHGRELGEGVGEAAAVGGALGFLGGGARALRKPLTKLVRNPAVRRGARRALTRLRTLPGRALSHSRQVRADAAAAAQRRLRSGRVNLALGRRRLDRALAPAKAAFARNVSDPVKRAFAPFAARIGRTRAGQATQRLWGRYLQALERAPVRTKSLTSAGIGMAGDLIAQSTDDEEGIDLKRTAFIGGFGLLYGGPVGHYWFNALERMIPGGGAKALIAKVALDQGVMNVVGTQVFFTTQGVVMEGKSVGDAFSSATDGTKSVVPTSWAFWVPFHGLNFAKVPLPLRKPAGDAAGLVWGVIFSRLAFAGDEEPPAEGPVASTEGTVSTGASTRARVEIDNGREGDLDGLIDAFTPIEHGAR